MAIKAVLLDCDGTLAGDSIFYFRSGDVARVFSTYDGEGIAMLKRKGVDVAIVTQSVAKEIQARAEWLRIGCHMGITDKESRLRYFAKENGLSVDEICFMGNDLSDLGALLICGYPAAPRNAHMRVWEYCVRNGFVTEAYGGNGAVRELVEHLVDRDFEVGFVHPPYP